MAGRITHLTDAAGAEDRLYGPLGEIVRETRAIPIQGGQVPTYTTQFTFDTWNRTAQMVYPDNPNGEVVQYFYDSGGLVNRVHGNDDQLETDYAANIIYDKFGQRLSMTNGNGVITTYAYDQRTRRLTNVQATLPVGYTFNNFNFSYDNVGNLTQLQNTAQMPGSFTAGGLGNAIGGPWTKQFNYDDLYRLTSSSGTHNVSATPTFTYSFSQVYDSIHNITHKTQTAMQDTAVNPQLSYDNAYSYPAPGSPHPHGTTAIGGFTITNDADGNQVRTLGTGTSAQSNYLYDEENRLSCANMGPQMPSPSCSSQGATQFIYDHAGVRKVKSASSPTIYPNQYYTDFGGGTAGSQFKHIFIGSERILTKKARIAPDRQHWYYHPDHLGSTAMVTNEKSQLVDAIHYFPFGEVWLEERPSSLPADYFFTAKEFDPETGFYNFGARYLDPRFSKWMTADPALGSYLPGVGAAVGYRSPALANAWRGHPDLPGLGGTFTPSNLALYGYGHQNPATLWDPDGGEPLVCTPDNIRGGPTLFFSNLSQGQADLQNLQAANQIATSWAGPIFGVLPALGRIFGASEQNVQVLAEVNFNIASTAAVMPRIAGGPLSVTAAMRRAAPIVGGGAKLENLAPGEIARIQNAANRTGTEITVVGSRARGTPGAESDWDYVVSPGTKSKTIHSLASSLPEGPRLGLDQARNQDIFREVVDETRPFITFRPASR